MKFIEVTQHNDKKPTIVPVNRIVLIEPDMIGKKQVTLVRVKFRENWIRELYCQEEPWILFNRIKGA